MKIKRHKQPQAITIEKFAEQHDLVMDVVERDTTALYKYYATFSDSEMKEGVHGVFLRGAFGNGTTEAEAIRDYAKQISGNVLVFNAMGENRKTIYVPPLR